jgi:23S rRNA A1618 N6-methylase RlmF
MFSKTSSTNVSTVLSLRSLTFVQEVDRFPVIQMDPLALFDGLIDERMHYDFVMCNPPFFCDTADAQALSTNRRSDRPIANSVNTAADVESIYQQGGEVEFVKRMIDESQRYQKNVR